MGKEKTYSKSFVDVKDIVDSFEERDLLQVCNGEFKDSPYVIYRDVVLLDKDPAAFIDLYHLPDMKDNEAAVVIGCKKRYRKHNQTKDLCIKMKENLPKGIEVLYWETKKHNASSLAIARSLGFKKGPKAANKENFLYILDTRIVEEPVKKKKKKEKGWKKREIALKKAMEEKEKEKEKERGKDV